MLPSPPTRLDLHSLLTIQPEEMEHLICCLPVSGMPTELLPCYHCVLRQPGATLTVRGWTLEAGEAHGDLIAQIGICCWKYMRTAWTSTDFFTFFYVILRISSTRHLDFPLEIHKVHSILLHLLSQATVLTKTTFLFNKYQASVSLFLFSWTLHQT